MFTFTSRSTRTGTKASTMAEWASSRAPTSRYRCPFLPLGKGRPCPKGHLFTENLCFVSSHVPPFFPLTSLPFSASSSCGEGSAQKVGTGADFGIRRSYCKVQLQWGYASRNVLPQGKPSPPCRGLCGRPCSLAGGIAGQQPLKDAPVKGA